VCPCNQTNLRLWYPFPLARPLLILFLLCFFLRLPSFSKTYWNLDEYHQSEASLVLLDGGVLYQDAFVHRGPLIYYLFAGVKWVFGVYDYFALKVVFLLLHLALVLVVFLLGRRLFSPQVGFFAGLCFIVQSSLSFAYAETMPFHIEWLMILFTSLGALALLNGLQSRKLSAFFFCGLCFALGVFAKQPAAFDCIAVVATLLLGFLRFGWGVKPLFALCGGGLLVTLLVVGHFAIHGALGDFWFGFFQYNTDYYLKSNTLSLRIAALPELLTLSLGPFYWGALLMGGIFLMFKDRRPSLPHVFLLLWAGMTFLATFLSGRNFYHYFFQTYPSFCLLSAVALGALFQRFKSSRLGYGAVALLLVLPHSANILPGPETEIQQQVTQIQGTVDYIRNHSSKEDRIFVWGFFPEIYTLTERRSASRFLTTNTLSGLIPWQCQWDFDWAAYIVPQHWDTLLRELKQNAPKFIIDTSPGDYRCYHHHPISHSPRLHRFLTDHYRPVQSFNEEDYRPAVVIYALNSPAH